MVGKEGLTLQDTALYQCLLGLKSPWTMSCVTLDVNGYCVDVWAEHSGGRDVDVSALLGDAAAL